MKELEKEIEKWSEVVRNAGKEYIKRSSVRNYNYWDTLRNYLDGLLKAKELIEKEMNK